MATHRVPDDDRQRTGQHGANNQKEHEMGTMKGLAAIPGFAVLIAVVVACGNGTGSMLTSDKVSSPVPGQLSEWDVEAQKAVLPIEGVYRTCPSQSFSGA